MKKLLPIIFLFALSLSVFGQESATKTAKEIQQQTKSFKNSKRYFAHYDKFEDRTFVRSIGFNLISSMAGALSIMAGGRGTPPTMMFLGAGFTFSGDALKETPSEYFLIFDYSGAEWQFLKTSKLIALIDGERVQFGEGEAIRDVQRGGVNEKIGFKITKQQLQQLSKAKSVEIKIGSYQSPLKAEYLEMFGNVLKLGDTTQKSEEKKK